jgi:hypothetical protein
MHLKYVESLSDWNGNDFKWELEENVIFMKQNHWVATVLFHIPFDNLT